MPTAVAMLSVRIGPAIGDADVVVLLNELKDRS